MKHAVRRDCYQYWNQLFAKSPDEVRVFTEIGLDCKEDFRRTLEGAFPWLRLCEGHWKADQLWVNYFGAWKKPRTLSQNAKESTPDSTTAVKSTSPAPVLGSKRHKGKEKDLMAPTVFHHSRPLAKKKVAQKMAKVRLYLVLFIIQHADNVRTHCTGSYFLKYSVLTIYP